MPFFKKQHVAKCFRHKAKQINILSMQLSGALMWENEQCGVSEIFSCLRRRPAWVGRRRTRPWPRLMPPKKPTRQNPLWFKTHLGLEEPLEHSSACICTPCSTVASITYVCRHKARCMAQCTSHSICWSCRQMCKHRHTAWDHTNAWGK